MNSSGGRSISAGQAVKCSEIPKMSVGQIGVILGPDSGPQALCLTLVNNLQ